MCFWRKMSKIKNKLYNRCLFLHFLYFFSKNITLSCPFLIYLKKIRHENGMFLTKNVKNQKSTILSMFYLCTIFDFFSKHACLMSIIFFFNRHESVVFLMKNVQNQKYTIISTSFLRDYTVLSAE